MPIRTGPPGPNDPSKNVTIYPQGLTATTVYSVAASTATTIDEETACLAAEGILRRLELPLLRVLADDNDRGALRKKLHLDAIDARVAKVLAAGELERRTEVKQDAKWIIDKWLVFAIALGGWLVALIVALVR